LAAKRRRRIRSGQFEQEAAEEAELYRTEILDYLIARHGEKLRAGWVPTILRVRGYHFRYYSVDIRERPHIHVVKSGKETKLWLDSLAFQWNGGFSEAELNEIRRIARQHLGILRKPWNQ